MKEEKEMEQMYWVYGVNDMGSTWYVSDKLSDRATLWPGASKDLRQRFSKAEAVNMAEHLDKIYEFGSTRHHIEPVNN